MKKLELHDKVWARGKGRSTLLITEPKRNDMDEFNDFKTYPEGSMCCMGIACVNLWNVPLERLAPKDTHYPSSVADALPEEILRPLEIQKHSDGTFHASGSPSSLERRIAEINDDSSFTDEQRIAELAPLFAELDIELEFVQ